MSLKICSFSFVQTSKSCIVYSLHGVGVLINQFKHTFLPFSRGWVGWMGHPMLCYFACKNKEKLNLSTTKWEIGSVSPPPFYVPV